MFGHIPFERSRAAPCDIARCRGLGRIDPRRADADDELDELYDTAGKEYEGEGKKPNQKGRDDLAGYIGAQGPMHIGDGSFL